MDTQRQGREAYPPLHHAGARAFYANFPTAMPPIRSLSQPIPSMPLLKPRTDNEHHKLQPMERHLHWAEIPDISDQSSSLSQSHSSIQSQQPASTCYNICFTCREKYMTAIIIIFDKLLVMISKLRGNFKLAQSKGEYRS